MALLNSVSLIKYVVPPHGQRYKIHGDLHSVAGLRYCNDARRIYEISLRYRNDIDDCRFNYCIQNHIHISLEDDLFVFSPSNKNPRIHMLQMDENMCRLCRCNTRILKYIQIDSVEAADHLRWNFCVLHTKSIKSKIYYWQFMTK